MAVIWGLCFVVIQAALPSPTPLLLAGLRAVIGGPVLEAWMLITRRRARGLGSKGPTSGSGERWSGLPPVSLLLVLALTNAAVAFGAMYLAAGRGSVDPRRWSTHRPHGRRLGDLR